jgi:hypothetical protein
MALPGKRVISDDDIRDFFTEVMALWNELDEEYNFSGPVEAVAFQTVANMVGKREIVGIASGLVGPQGLPGS